MVKARGRPKGKTAKDSEQAFEERRLEILRTAARTFSERGFHATSIADLAKILDVTKPSIYHYIGSKDEMLFEAGSVALERLAGALERAVASDDTGLERLKGFFIRYVEIICDDFGRCLVLTDPQWLEPESREKNVLGRRLLTEKIEEIIGEGIKDGSIAKCDPRMMAFTFFAACNGVPRWYRPNKSFAPSEIAERVLSVLIEGARIRS